MNKSVVIIISAVWLICTTYMTLARIYDYPYRFHAMLGSWAASILLLYFIIVYIRKHKNTRKNT